MRPHTRLEWLAAAALLTVLVAPVAGGAAPVRKGTRAVAPADAYDTLRVVQANPASRVLPTLRSSVGVNLTSDALDSPGVSRLLLDIAVDSLGMVRDVQIVKGGTPYDSAAVDAARWWLFDPARVDAKPVAMRVTVPFEITIPADADPMSPDVLALARSAEKRGDLLAALDAWTGLVARIGTHPLLADDYTPRVQAIRLAKRVAPPAEMTRLAESRSRGTYNQMLRNISRAANADYAAAYDEALRIAPWYVPAYRWRASARAACGQRDGAMRDVRLYAIGSPDSTSQALAARALRALAAGDTIAALTMLK